jgi:hypothetical protein
LSTRITNGSTPFSGVRNNSAAALAVAHSQPALATHQAVRSLRFV